VGIDKTQYVQFVIRRTVKRGMIALVVFAAIVGAFIGLAQLMPNPSQAFMTFRLVTVVGAFFLLPAWVGYGDEPPSAPPPRGRLLSLVDRPIPLAEPSSDQQDLEAA